MVKVKQIKSMQERLEEAIVPKEQAPFAIPENWCWVKAGNIGMLGMGQTILSKDLKSNGIPVYSATEEDKIFGYIEPENNRIQLKKGDLVIPARGNSIGYVKYIEVDDATCSQTTMFYKPNLKTIGKYIYYFFKGYKENLFIYYGNAIPQITVGNISEKLIPLAPIAEQKRILDKIESLFSRLDEAKELIQKSLDEFEDRKSAILHKAFNGELTGNIETVFNEKFFLDCVEDMQNGISKRKGDVGQEVIVLRLADISSGEISLGNVRKIKLDIQEKDKYLLKNDDVLMIRVNGSKENVGKQILFNSKEDISYCDHIIRIKYKKSVISKYMIYFSHTKNYKQYVLDNLVSSAGQNTISRKGLSRLKVNIPPIEEQQEIVRILDNFFEKEDKSKELLDMIDQIEEMKKSILARAFRGELGTHSDGDEPAIELVKNILEGEL